MPVCKITQRYTTSHEFEYAPIGGASISRYDVRNAVRCESYDTLFGTIALNQLDDQTMMNLRTMGTRYKYFRIKGVKHRIFTSRTDKPGKPPSWDFLVTTTKVEEDQMSRTPADEVASQSQYMRAHPRTVRGVRSLTKYFKLKKFPWCEVDGQSMSLDQVSVDSTSGAGPFNVTVKNIRYDAPSLAEVFSEDIDRFGVRGVEMIPTVDVVTVGAGNMYPLRQLNWFNIFRQAYDVNTFYLLDQRSPATGPYISRAKLVGGGTDFRLIYREGVANAHYPRSLFILPSRKDIDYSRAASGAATKWSTVVPPAILQHSFTYYVEFRNPRPFNRDDTVAPLVWQPAVGPQRNADGAFFKHSTESDGMSSTDSDDNDVDETAVVDLSMPLPPPNTDGLSAFRKNAPAPKKMKMETMNLPLE